MHTTEHSASVADAQSQQKPEWLRIEAAVKLFGISRTKLYDLISNKRIKSFCLRERGKIKGLRLISYDSLCQFLESEAQAQEVAAQEVAAQ
jgi:hypothetical protein